MDVIRQWITGITCASIILAAAESLMPEGGVKKAGRLAGGLLLMLAVVQPLAGVDYEALSEALGRSRAWDAGYSEALELENLELMKLIIEEQTAAYISDKAEELGMECTAQVVYHYGADGEVWPESVTVRGVFTQSQQESLSRTLEAELAIPTENQTYERVSDP